MNAILIGDVGATGSDWVFSVAGEVKRFSLGGYNPVSQGQERLISILTDLRAQIGAVRVDVFYYGAGVGIQGHMATMRDQFERHLHLGQLVMESDLLGAARALCGREEGVVCILGTGSNACYYDGVSLSPGHSLGYPLGDEGSGMDIGRRIVRSFYYGLFPNDLKEHFQQFLPDNRLDFLDILQKERAPNRYLANLVVGLLDVKNEPFIQQLILNSFADFAENHLHHFKRNAKINAVGSIAFYFCGEFGKCLDMYELSLGKIIRKPVDNLIVFHSSQ